jgi:hypothetical protein
LTGSFGYGKMKKKIGRPSYLSKSKSYAEKVKKAFNVHKTVRRTAKALGISRQTVSDYLKQFNIDTLPTGGAYQKYFPKQKKYGAFERWLLEHPDETLPKEPIKISRMTGINPNTIRCSLYRFRKRQRDRIKKLPDIRRSEVFLEDVFERVFLTSDIKKYMLKFDKYTLELIIDAVMMDDKETSFKIRDVDSFRKELERKRLI